MNKIQKEVDIVKLVFPESIRTRQGMYGSDGENADILLREIIDNGVDLVLKTRQSIEIKSFTNIDGYHCVIDNGQGLPIYKDNDHDIEQPITIDLLTQINVGSNFHKTQYSAGMNGVGSKLTNALSDEFIVFVNAKKKDINTLTDYMQNNVKIGNTIYVIHFKRGILEQQLMIPYNKLGDYMDGNSDEVDKILSGVSEDFGTIIVFKPDSTLVQDTNAKYHGYPFKIIKGLLNHDKDFANVNVNFTLNNKEIPAFDFKEVFSGDKFIDDKIFTDSVSIKTNEPLPIKFIYQVAWEQDKFNTDSDGSVNLLKTPSGRHISIVQAGITLAFTKYNSIITGGDSKLGQRLFSLSLAIEPLFNSQDKTKLSNYQDKGFIESDAVKIVCDSFIKIMKENSEYFDLICARIIEYKKQMNNLSNIDLLKSSIIMGDEGDKRRAMSGEMSRVYECTSRDWNKRELYVTEGNSASQSIIELRNKQFQSCLPLRGKLINTTGFDETDLTSNKEILAIINTIGCGIGAVTDISKSRYSKIIIATDADSDGSHIANLITALFYSHVPELIKNGMLYKLETPYYRITNGSTIEYKYYHDKDSINFNNNSTIRKLKGLGSFDTRNPDAVNKYIINPSTRRLIQINYEDIDENEVKESAKLFSSSLSRKQLMEEIGVLTKETKEVKYA